MGLRDCCYWILFFLIFALFFLVFYTFLWPKVVACWKSFKVKSFSFIVVSSLWGQIGMHNKSFLAVFVLTLEICKNNLPSITSILSLKGVALIACCREDSRLKRSRIIENMISVHLRLTLIRKNHWRRKGSNHWRFELSHNKALYDSYHRLMLGSWNYRHIHRQGFDDVSTSTLFIINKEGQKIFKCTQLISKILNFRLFRCRLIIQIVLSILCIQI